LLLLLLLLSISFGGASRRERKTQTERERLAFPSCPSSKKTILMERAKKTRPALQSKLMLFERPSPFAFPQ
jgi:hypothetical protein